MMAIVVSRMLIVAAFFFYLAIIDTVHGVPLDRSRHYAMVRSLHVLSMILGSNHVYCAARTRT